jgi:hypothetical protein
MEYFYIFVGSDMNFLKNMLVNIRILHILVHYE